jgi:DNA-directed RNA polymerase omega subunit
MPLLPTCGDKLDTHRSVRRFRADGRLLHGQGLLRLCSGKAPMVLNRNKNRGVEASDMPVTNEIASDGFNVLNDDEWPGIDSKFRLIVVAALRSKQLLNGSVPRIDADPLKRRNTSIALEEVKQGLVPFTNGNDD